MQADGHTMVLSVAIRSSGFWQIPAAAQRRIAINPKLSTSPLSTRNALTCFLTGSVRLL